MIMGYGAGNSAMLKNFSKKVGHGNEVRGLLRGLRGDGDHDDIDDGEENLGFDLLHEK